MVNTEVRMREEAPFSLFTAIQNGGYILYFRHGETTNNHDQPNLDLNDCRTQRNLNENGKNQAKGIGDIFRKQKIPIQFPVMASPYCRTQETAEIAFGKQNIEKNDDLAFIFLLKRGDLNAEQQKIKKNLIKIFETVPSPNFNKVIIGHSFSFDNSDVEIPYMGTVVLKPRGPEKGYEFTSMIKLEQFINWSNENG